MTEPKKLTALEKLDQRIEQLRNRRAVIVQKETGEQRKLRNRRASILGGWLMANEPEKVALIIAKLQRPQDIAAFSEGIYHCSNPLTISYSTGSCTPSNSQIPGEIDHLPALNRGSYDMDQTITVP